MKLGRIFANAIVRRLAYVLVAAALAWVGLGDARAQNTNNVDQGAALSACNSAHAAGMAAQNTNQYFVYPGQGCVHFPVQRYYSCGFQRLAKTNPNGTPTNVSCGLHYYQAAGACNARPGTTFSNPLVIPTGSVGCSNGCAYQVVNNGDGTYATTFAHLGSETCNVLPQCTQPGWYLNNATSLCQPPEVECPGNQTKNPNTGACQEACPTGMVMDAQGACKPSADDCPAGNVRSPSGQCLPGDGQCAAGEARRDNGTCGVDSDGDGEADEDDEDPENDPDRETASGGDSCSAPPACSGGPIDCMQVKIQWRIDCNTRRKVNISGGACSAMPVCTGENCDAMEYAQLVQQWKAACALADLEVGEGGSGDNQDLIDLLTDPGTIEGSYGDTGGMPGGEGFEFGDTDVPEPDTSGYGYGSSCPSPPSFTVYGQTISINLTPMCNWVGLAGNLVLILAALASMRIVSGGAA